jgi:sugar fermentation stimulation protein A
MKLTVPTQTATLLRRYKRFLADVRLEDGSVLTVHCPNSGSMLGCSTPGSQVLISRSANPRRKYSWTLEMVRENNTWIGVNTALTNSLVREAIENRTIDDFGEIETIIPEVRVSEKSRLDFRLRAGGQDIYVEVKNCSLAKNGAAMFPDAVTARGTRHLLELESLLAQRQQAALIFCVQREDAKRFTPAADIDPLYAETLARVHGRGLTVLACQAEVGPEAIRIARKIPVVIGRTSKKPGRTDE